jgi:hypothetical protein
MGLYPTLTASFRLTRPLPLVLPLHCFTASIVRVIRILFYLLWSYPDACPPGLLLSVLPSQPQQS